MLLPLLGFLCLWLCSEAVATQVHWQKTKTTLNHNSESTTVAWNTQSRRWRTVILSENRVKHGASTQASRLDSINPEHSEQLRTRIPQYSVRKSDARIETQHGHTGKADLSTDASNIQKLQRERYTPAEVQSEPQHGRNSSIQRQRRSSKRHRAKRSEDGTQPVVMAQEQDAETPFGLNTSDYEEYILPDFPDSNPFEPVDPRVRRKQVKNPFYPVTPESYGAYAVMITAALILSVGIIGNVSIMCIVCHNYYMRNICNSLLANLALWDFVIIFFCLPLVVFHAITKDWLLGELSCRIIPYLEVRVQHQSSLVTVETMF